MDVRSRFDRFMAGLEQAIRRPTDDPAAGVRKAYFTLIMAITAVVAALWSLIYVASGAWPAGAICFLYSLVSFVNLVALARTRWFGRYQVVQLAAILTAPFLMQLTLGGFVGGSGAVVWSLICPLSAVLFGPVRDAARWLLAYLALVAVALVAQPSLTNESDLPQWVVATLFVLNLGAVSSIAFAMLATFVRARDALRDLERAYVEQALVLQQREKLATLGTLAAGVAHELNNPAAAVRRAGEQLARVLGQMAGGILAICDNGRVPEIDRGARVLDALRRRPGAGSEDLSPLQRADREEGVEAWLDAHGVPEPWELAPTLVSMGATAEDLEPLADDVAAEQLPALVSLLVQYAAARDLAESVTSGSSRISEIVGALRSYAYLDRGAVQVVDVHHGIDDTLVLLSSNLKHMSVERRYGEGVPPVEARGGELNQVWTNIVDNAVAATDGTGRLVVRTAHVDGKVVVELEDDGPGIPRGIVGRVFDPFFTTKPPGTGSGLGLSISHSIIAEHGGELTVDSEPGRTTFRVTLPAARPGSAASTSSPTTRPSTRARTGDEPALAGGDAAGGQ